MVVWTGARIENSNRGARATRDSRGSRGSKVVEQKSVGGGRKEKDSGFDRSKNREL